MIKEFVLYQGKLNGRSIVQGSKKKIGIGRGPLTAARNMFPNAEIRKATATEIFGHQGNQFTSVGGRMVYSGKPHKAPENWIQLNDMATGQSYYFVLTKRK